MSRTDVVTGDRRFPDGRPFEDTTAFVRSSFSLEERKSVTRHTIASILLLGAAVVVYRGTHATPSSGRAGAHRVVASMELARSCSRGVHGRKQAPLFQPTLRLAA
jgi:hypothetical protein